MNFAICERKSAVALLAVTVQGSAGTVEAASLEVRRSLNRDNKCSPETLEALGFGVPVGVSKSCTTSKSNSGVA